MPLCCYPQGVHPPPTTRLNARENNNENDCEVACGQQLFSYSKDTKAFWGIYIFMFSVSIHVIICALENNQNRINWGVHASVHSETTPDI